MNKKYKKSLFIFRRDLRLEDNLGLLEALENSDVVAPLFIFDPQQANPKKNEYFSENAFEFMIASIKDLEQSLEKKGGLLYLAEGGYIDVISEWIQKEKIEAIYVNKDYTPFARRRDGAIDELCKKHEIDFIRVADYALAPLEDIVTGQGKKYSVFTPFMNAARQYDVPDPRKNNFKNYYSQKIQVPTISLNKYDLYSNKNIAIKGGRKEALKRMKDDSFIATYEKNRDIPSVDGTSMLSAHLKFGTVSVREVFAFAQSAKANPTKFTNELYWRDFYMYISYHYPYVFKKSFQRRGEFMAWENDAKQFKAWCEGKTGVPFVDAGMRQLNETGWMHNRVRMIVASYLTKNLLIDWRWGEKYFAQKLVDYDPSSNNGGWQWSASLGADPKPIRIFNAVTQAQKFDGDLVYIKKWVHELDDESYPKPLVDDKISFHRAMAAFKAAKEKSLEN